MSDHKNDDLSGNVIENKMTLLNDEGDDGYCRLDRKQTHHQKQPIPPLRSILVPSVGLVNEGNDVARSDDQEQCPPNTAASDNGKSSSVPRVSFAPRPSYFADPAAMTESSRRSSRSHRRTKSSSQDHSDRDVVKEGAGSRRKQYNDGSSSSRNPSRRSSSSNRERESSAPRRSSHRRSNARRRSHSSQRHQNSNYRRSEHGGRRSNVPDLETSKRERDTKTIDDVDLDESTSSWDKDKIEDQFDDEYYAEGRGQKGQKERQSKERRSKSELQSSSIKRDHSRHNRSDSFKHSTSSNDKSKLKSHRRSSSLDEIRTGYEMRSQSSFEVAPKSKQRQYNDAAKEKSRQREERRLRNRAMRCCGLLFCCLSTLGILVAVIIRGGVLDFAFRTSTGDSSNNQKPVLIAPTAEKCRAISKGIQTTSESDLLADLKHFQIRMEVELDDRKKESDMPFLPRLESTLQERLMPILAGCEISTPRRYRRMMEPPAESRLRSKEGLPDYVISNGLIVDAQFDLKKTVAVKSAQQSKYPIVVLVDLWIQQEVDKSLLKNKVWKVFDGFMETPGIAKDFSLAASMVLSVDVISETEDTREGTPFPTLQPSSGPSYAPSSMDSSIPTLSPSMNPTMNPSSVPSSRPTGLPTLEPSMTPTATPSIQPSDRPTARPTLFPTRSPTVAPVTSNPTRPPVPADTSLDVVIVGAGAAGLSAAYHLQREGVSVVILEASNKIGGRIRKDSTWDLGLDLGAEWLDFRASQYDDSNELLSAILDRTVSYQTIREPNLAHSWTGSTMEYNPPGSTSAEFRWVDSTWWDFLNRELVSYLQPNTVLLESVVKTIDYGYEKPIVKLADGRAYEASHVIVTASTKILQDRIISFVPSLPSDYQEAIDDIEMGSGIKVFLEFREKFFPDIFQLDPDKEIYNFKDCESSRHGLRYFYSPTYGQASSKHILGMFAYADIADLYIGKPHGTIIQSVLGLLDQIFGGKASNTFVKGVVQDWSSEPYVRTAYTMVAPKDAVEQLRRPIDDKVFFAGESVYSKDSDWGFAHGAALCGEDVAEDIIDVINGQ